VAELRAGLQGRWRIAGVEPSDAIDPAAHAALVARAFAFEVRVEGDRLLLRSPAGEIDRRIEIHPLDDGLFELRLVDAYGGAHRAIGRADRHGVVTIEGLDAPWVGRATLVR
jgi:hypothetical protein